MKFAMGDDCDVIGPVVWTKKHQPVMVPPGSVARVDTHCFQGTTDACDSYWAVVTMPGQEPALYEVRGTALKRK